MPVSHLRTTTTFAYSTKILASIHVVAPCEDPDSAEDCCENQALRLRENMPERRNVEEVFRKEILQLSKRATISSVSCNHDSPRVPIKKTTVQSTGKSYSHTTACTVGGSLDIPLA